MKSSTPGCCAKPRPCRRPRGRACSRCNPGIAWRLRTAYARDVARGAARDMNPVALANIWIALTNHYLMNRDLFAPGESVVAARGAELKAQWLEIIRP